MKLQPNDAFLYISVGNVYELKHDYTNAYNSYLEALRIYPDYTYNYVNIANTAYLLGDFASATEYYKRFLSNYPDNVEAQRKFGLLLYENKRPSKMLLAVYGKLYTDNPNGFKQFSNYGLALLKTNELDMAVDFLQKSCQEKS
ncbi:MAG: hypothetical protein L6V95_07375 [Candidatus Melainabacteria bacterium]|nr:MAG: hypothetical protein L6V95_07375 [Candidatus Melainabacteria bacterium]